MNVLHAGSLDAENVTEDSWVREHAGKDLCAEVLTQRIRGLHGRDYHPLEVKYGTRAVQLDGEEYKAWAGKLATSIGGDPSADVPFTLWEIKPLAPGRSVLRLCLRMWDKTYRGRFAGKTSFFAHGEAILLRNIEDGDLPVYRGVSADKYRELFATFKSAHKVSEAFEYLIVSPDGRDLAWDAVALSTSISPKFIRAGTLARTTRWFATDSSYVGDFELKADFVLEVAKLGQTEQLPPSKGEELVSQSVDIGVEAD
jgi:hypothetical protein